MVEAADAGEVVEVAVVVIEVLKTKVGIVCLNLVIIGNDIKTTVVVIQKVLQEVIIATVRMMTMTM